MQVHIDSLEMDFGTQLDFGAEIDRFHLTGQLEATHQAGEKDHSQFYLTIHVPLTKAEHDQIARVSREPVPVVTVEEDDGEVLA